MKKLMAGIIIFAVSISLAWSQTSQSPAKSTLHTWSVVITPHSKKHYLDSLSAAWKKDSITLKFEKLKYNAQGNLVKLKGSIDIVARGKHASGTFSSDSLKSFEVMVNDGPGVSLKGK